MKNKELFFELMKIERERQLKKFPNEERQKELSLDRWNSILTEETGEFAKEINDKNELKALIELTECAAVCLKIAEVYFSNEQLEKAYEIMFERTKNQTSKY